MHTKLNMHVLQFSCGCTFTLHNKYGCLKQFTYQGVNTVLQQSLWVITNTSDQTGFKQAQFSFIDWTLKRLHKFSITNGYYNSGDLPDSSQLAWFLVICRSKDNIGDYNRMFGFTFVSMFQKNVSFGCIPAHILSACDQWTQEEIVPVTET